MLDRSGRGVYGPDHDQFRDVVRRFLADEFTPNLLAFEEAGKVSRSL